MRVDTVNSGKMDINWVKETNGNIWSPKESVTNKATPAEAPETLKPSPVQEESGESYDGKAGVLRLLQEGHFKGVADVRLCINFQEELTSMQQESVKPVVENGIPIVLKVVQAGIDSILSGGTLAEGVPEDIQKFAQQFIEAVNQSRENFLETKGAARDTLALQIETSFEALVSSLESALQPEETVPPAPVGEILEEGTPENMPVPTGQDFKSVIDTMTADFTAALDEFVKSMSEVQTLPELSGPKGNGGAYEKFLAIYNQIWSLETNDGDPGKPPLAVV